MRRFKDTMVGKGSALSEALDSKDKKLAEKVYAETSDRYKTQVPNPEDRAWFLSAAQRNMNTQDHIQKWDAIDAAGQVKLDTAKEVFKEKFDSIGN